MISKNTISDMITESCKEDIYIEELSTIEMVKLINREDKTVALSIEKNLDKIALLIDAIVPKMQTGGRLIYIGAGTSGRLGVIDAAECPPTFGVSDEIVQGLIIGGKNAVYKAVEYSEDDVNAGINELKKICLCKNDICIGISASGYAPSIIEALKYAKELNALTACVICNSNTDLEKLCEYAVTVIVGAEVISGSTRMKAGTAQKMVLNMISSCVMVKLGKVYKNMMINMVPTNKKLVNRAVKILSKIFKIDNTMALEKLKENNFDLNKTISIEKQDLI